MEIDQILYLIWKCRLIKSFTWSESVDWSNPLPDLNLEIDQILYLIWKGGLIRSFTWSEKGGWSDPLPDLKMETPYPERETDWILGPGTEYPDPGTGSSCPGTWVSSSARWTCSLGEAGGEQCRRGFCWGRRRRGRQGQGQELSSLLQ